MKKTLMVVGLGLGLFICLFLLNAAPSPQETIYQEYVPGEVLVKFKPMAGKQAAIAVLDVIKPRVVNYLGQEIAFTDWDPEVTLKSSFLGDPHLVHLRVPETIGTEKAISMLKNNPNVEYVEPNYIYCFYETIPNDPYIYLQWGLNNTGQSGGTVDSDIDAPEAWDIFTGSQDVVVAVIDSGIDYSHVDLAQNIWINPGEIPNNGIDDDGNGYVDDCRGWNFYSNNNNPMDYLGHGTHVAGIIGAVGNNGTGVTGVCWNVKLMALRIVPDAASAIKAIDYAISMEAKIMNASWGSPSYSSSLLSAIGRAQAAGALFIAAAGNSPPPGKNNDLTPYYPSSYDLDNIIAVLSTDHNDNKSGFSHYGIYSVDLSAPGGSDTIQSSYNIYSTFRENKYRYLSGTSMATPFVTGLAALLLGQRPEIDWWQRKTIILKSVDVKSQLQGKVRTSGRLNAYNSLICSTPVLPAAPSNLRGVAFKNGDFYDLELTWTDNSNNESGFAIYLKSGNVFFQIDQVAQDVTTYWLVEVPAGYYYFYIRAFNTDGESLKTPQIAVKAFYY
ncbi:MAG: S8 family serine peptidase [Candidatus Saccharicenans sp.]|nr:S8 family serine peptidase [Candidatus Saccharicenans sp.]